MSWAITHKGLIVKVARLVHRRAVAAGAAVDLHDLIQDGCVIAIGAERTYRAQQASPSTYLYQSLLRSLNKRVDTCIYQSRNEQRLDIPDYPIVDASDELALRDFLGQLSKPAQVVLMSWLQPSRALQRAIAARTVGRRCSFRALILYLKERGHDPNVLTKIQTEILSKVDLYE